MAAHGIVLERHGRKVAPLPTSAYQAILLHQQHPLLDPLLRHKSVLKYVGCNFVPLLDTNVGVELPMDAEINSAPRILVLGIGEICEGLLDPWSGVASARRVVVPVVFVRHEGKLFLVTVSFPVFSEGLKDSAAKNGVTRREGRKGRRQIARGVRAVRHGCSLRCPSRAVQRCWVGGIESALPHIRGEVRWLIQEGFANRRMSDLCGGNWVGGCHGCVLAFVGRAGGRS